MLYEVIHSFPTRRSSDLKATRENIKNKSFVASQGVMDRVNHNISKNLAQSYNDGVGIDNAARSLQKEFSKLSGYEATRIARTEINSAQNEGAFQAYYDFDISYHQWWTGQDARVRDSHRAIHGKMQGSWLISGQFSGELNQKIISSAIYTKWVNDGTGIYGPRGQLIRPKTARLLGPFKYKGRMIAVPWVSIREALSPITSALGNLWTALSVVWSAFSGGQAAQANSTFNQIGNVITALWAVISSALLPVFQNLYGVLVQVANFIGGFFSAVWTTIGGSIRAVINYIVLFINALAQLLSGQITFSQFASLIWNGFKSMLLTILMSIILGVGSWAAQLLVKGKNAALGFVNGIISYVTSLPGKVWAYLLSTLSRITRFAGSAANYARSAGSRIVSGLRTAVSQAPGVVYNELSGIVGRMLSIGGQLYNTARNLGANIVNNLKKGLGIASPGHMYWAMVGELNRLDMVLDENKSILGDKAATLGDAIQSGFGSPSLDVKANLTAKIPDVSENMDIDILVLNNDETLIGWLNPSLVDITEYNDDSGLQNIKLTHPVNDDTKNDYDSWLEHGHRIR